MYKKTLEIIKDKYEIDISDLNIEFHYTPSTYHLHLHFVNKKKKTHLIFIINIHIMMLLIILRMMKIII